MKLIANEYEPKEVFKIAREWTELTQEELGKSMGKKGRDWAKFIENGKSRFYFNDFFEMCKKYGITITLEKKK